MLRSDHTPSWWTILFLSNWSSQFSVWGLHVLCVSAWDSFRRFTFLPQSTDMQLRWSEHLKLPLQVRVGGLMEWVHSYGCVCAMLNPSVAAENMEIKGGVMYTQRSCVTFSNYLSSFHASVYQRERVFSSSPKKGEAVDQSTKNTFPCKYKVFLCMAQQNWLKIEMINPLGSRPLLSKFHHDLTVIYWYFFDWYLSKW